VWIAAGVIVALAVGLSAFFLFREGDGKTAAGKPGSAGQDRTAEQVTKAFFEAVDDLDEKAMKDVTRGEVRDEIKYIMKSGGNTYGVVFGDGKVTDTADKQVGDASLAVVIWEVVLDLPDVPSEAGELAVALLDDGDGFKICAVQEDTVDAEEAMEEFAGDFEEICDYA